MHPCPGISLGDPKLVSHLGVVQSAQLMKDEGRSLGVRQFIKRCSYGSHHGRIRNRLTYIGAWRSGLHAEALRQVPLPGPARSVVGAYIRRDQTQPRSQPVLTAEAVDCTERPLEYLLDDVLCLRPAEQATMRLAEQHRIVVPDDLGESLGITSPVSFHKVSIAPRAWPIEPVRG